MKNRYSKILVLVSLIAVLSAGTAMAGNDDRRGTAGASELLINPWARSAGWGGVNTACAQGVEAVYTNVAGLSFLGKTEVIYSNTQWFSGYGASINAFGFGQRLGAADVIGVAIMGVGFGDIPITTVESPEQGSNGTYSPSLFNINVMYAHSFSNSIHGGVNIKVISESTDNVSAMGVAIDAGIQYVTGDDDEFKFGVSLKNIGPALSFSGDGLARTLVDWGGVSKTVEERSQAFEMPTCLNIGLSYDFLFDAYDQRLTLAGNFTSNAFMKDNFIVGAEYSLLNMFQVRGGFVYQNDIFSEANRTSAMTGPTAGASVKIPLSKQKGDKPASSIGLDYSYRSAAPFKGSHSIGVVLSF